MNKLSARYSLLMLPALLMLVSHAVGQIQYTTTCPSGEWDVLSVSVLDPGLVSADYHMQGTLTNSSGTQTAYMFTTWDQSNDKVYYVKNYKGYPWDINLYDSNYIYQWITEVTWSDPYQYKKFNNESGSSTSDYSFPWAPRCGTPGSWSLWNTPTATGSQFSTYFEIHPQTPTSSPSPSECTLPDEVKNLGYTLVELKATANITIYDERTSPATTITALDLPLQYTWGCLSENVNSCSDREVFDYGVDNTPNPVDNVKHSYGWVQWRHYQNSANYKQTSPPPPPAIWGDPVTTSLQNELTANSPANEGAVDFPCF
jgi:hypothetical protein